MILKEQIKVNQDEIQDVPTVVFDSVVQEIEIGKWLGVLSKGYFFNSISGINDTKICYRIGRMLSLLGVDNTELCVFSNYRKNEAEDFEDNFSFNCHFYNDESDAKITMTSCVGASLNIIFDYKNTSKVFQYNKEYNGDIYFKPIDFTSKNDAIGNTYHRSFRYYYPSFYLMNGDRKLSVKLHPNALPYDNKHLMVELDNESELEEYLLGLSFPFDFIDVSRKICEISLNPVSDYTNISIKLEEKGNKVFFKTTNLIDIERGKLKEFIVEKDGKTISVDKACNWSYESPEVTVVAKDKINMTFNVSDEDIDNTINPMTELDKISREVRQVKELTKTIFKN